MLVMADFYGTIDTLPVNPKVAVPEPGTLPLLAVGLACVGFVLRRKASRSGAQCLGRTTTRRTTAPSRVKSAEIGIPRSRSERICRE